MSKASSKRKSRQQRRQERKAVHRAVPDPEKAGIGVDRVHADDDMVEIVQTTEGVADGDDSATNDVATTSDAASDDIEVVRGEIDVFQPVEDGDQPSGVVSKLFGKGKKTVDADTGLVKFQQKPGVLRPFKRKEYQREAALASIRGGFGQLSHLMADIRDGLDASVERQGELLDQLKYLPVVAKQNADASEAMKQQFSRANELQGEAVRAIKEQVTGQRETAEQLNSLLSTMSKDARNQKQDMDDLQSRLERMRESDQAISSNLAGVGTALKDVSAQAGGQGEMMLKMQEQFEVRTVALQEQMKKQSGRQSLLTVFALLLAFFALGAVLAVGYILLVNNGSIEPIF
ncbi:MAG: hypothetical protein AAGK78_05045 [Planctomycetota bacterium]